MTSFAGWEMPVQYTSIIEEHMSVRERAGLFDVSHMGELYVEGKNAARLLDETTCNTVFDIPVGKVRYNAVLNARAGIIDDVTIYRLDEHVFLVVSNASNYERVYAHLTRGTQSDVSVRNASPATHLLAIQGPLAQEILETVLGRPLEGIGYYCFERWEAHGDAIIVSRTGYTGEDGFEVYTSNPRGVTLWDNLLTAGADVGLLPVGLGARDTLRLEAAYPLYGHELNEDLSPVESGLGWIVKQKAVGYPEQQRLLKEKEQGTARRVVGLRLTESGVPRDGYAVLDPANGTQVGTVLSGGYSPVLKAGIATTLLPAAFTAPEAPLAVEIRGKAVAAVAKKGPFVQGGARRNK